MQTGLTPFIVNMMRTPREKLERADVAKLADRYGIRQDWARWYLEQWLATHEGD